MKVHHSIFVAHDIAEPMFSECGAHLRHEGEFGSCDITEDDPRWPCVSAALARYQTVKDTLRGFPIPGSCPGDRVWTEFTDDERNRAPFLEMTASWVHGYPQPEDLKLDALAGPDQLVYLRRTYDFSDGCEKCWEGMKQIAPFRMKKSPVWGRRSILQMNWLHDEFFVKPDVYQAIFRPFGIGCRPVLLHKTGAQLDTVVQLSIDAVADVRVDGIPLQPAGQVFPLGVCIRCGCKNYQLKYRGYPPMPVHASAPLFKSTQCFNVGKRVYVTNSLYRKIVDAKLKGADFDPCL